MNELKCNDTYLSMEEMKINIENIKTNISNYKNKETLINILNFIDLTSLNSIDTKEEIRNLTTCINDFKDHFNNYKNVAAICVYPSLVSVVKEEMKVDNVKIASVGGGFPSSQTFLSVKIAECELAAYNGADEIDIVIPIGEFLKKNYRRVIYEIQMIKNSIKADLKVILETGELSTVENIYNASILSMESGADFIKTSTGKTPISATPEAVYIMCQAIKEFYKKTGKKIGIKPSGGISTSEDAILYYLIVKNVLGDEWLNNTLFRIGASRLTNKILSDLNKLEGKEEDINYF